MSNKKIVKEIFHSKSKSTELLYIDEFDLLGNKIKHQNGSFFENWCYDVNNNLISYENPIFFEQYRYIKKTNEILYLNSSEERWKKTLDVHRNEISYEEKKNLAWKLKFMENHLKLGKKLGLKWIKEYNEKNLEVYYKDNLNIEIWKTYDTYNNIVKRTNKKNIFESFLYEYDEHGNMILYKDSKGKEWFREYDIHGNLLNHTENKEIIINTYCDNLLIKTQHSNGRISSYKYNEDHQVIQRLDNNGYKENTWYDVYNNIIKIDNDICTRDFEISYW